MQAMSDHEDELSDAELAEMVADAIALATNYISKPDGPRDEHEMLMAIIQERSGDEFVESFRIVQGLLGIITVLTDWRHRGTGIAPLETLQQIASVNERRRLGGE